MSHQFNVIIEFQAETPDDMLDVADALGNASCLDASVGGHDEGAEIVFHREADSLDAAIKSAVSAVESAGYRVIRVELARDTISL
jgi:hypothetical protein